ncbi:MAG: DUF192 domain-containing protein [Cyclobacteriaceae bacterium]|nr:DUF192 domain-containing protein [Cyclobacteriaceae bacterium]
MGIQKNNWYKIAIGVLFLGALYLLWSLFYNKAEVPEKTSSSIAVEPQFSKEGILSFVSPQGDTLVTVDIEIADNDPERTQGMMYRSAMDYGKAMLFIMEHDSHQSFWMRNTKLSLDIIYVNADQEIVTIYKHTMPYSESPIPSFKRSKYVVETAAGFAINMA